MPNIRYTRPKYNYLLALNPEDAERLRQLAESEERPRATVIRRLIREAAARGLAPAPGLTPTTTPA